MSMMDETPSYFIEKGKIWSHHTGSEYTSGGFTEYEPSWNSELCEATPRNIRRYSSESGLYSYDLHEYVKIEESNYKDSFGKELFEGDEVYVVYTDYSDRFGGYMKCKIIGFTKLFTKLKVIAASKEYLITDKPILRLPHRLILI